MEREMTREPETLAQSSPPATGLAKPNEQILHLLVGELDHRLGNILALVQVLVAQTSSVTVEEYRAKLIARIAGLANVQKLIGRPRSLWLAELLEQTVHPYGTGGERRFDLAGPDVALEPNLALRLHLVFHELATNANKHGALSSPAGWVKIRWELLHPADGLMLAIFWSEHGGPKVKPPERRGFGSRLITEALAQMQGRVELRFGANGVACRILIRMDGPSIADCGGEAP
jgi:two-component sensor histidine kinase